MKVLVDVFVPAISEHYDVLLPVFLTVKEAVPLITRAVCDVSDNRYVTSNQEFLCFLERSMVMREDYTIERYGVRNGDHLLLI